MARPAKITPLETPKGWMVAVPKSMGADGKRHQRYFPDRTTAEKFASNLRSSYAKGHRGSLISHSLATQAAEAERILAGSGISLAEAARMAVAKAGGNPETFDQRWKTAMLDGETRWSDVYRSRIENLPRLLPPWFLATKCSVIDRDVMERALLEQSPALFRSTLDLRCSHISAVIGYRERHRKSGEIAILDAAGVTALLDACAAPNERRAVALLLFAGIRPNAEDGEISRLDWSAVGASEIYVSASVAKTKTDRHIPLTPRLRREIRGHPKSGPVIPADWKRTWARIRKAAGVTVPDICRHTFASAFLAAFGEDAAKQAMGHAQGSATLFRHYRRAVTEKEGKGFFR